MRRRGTDRAPLARGEDVSFIRDHAPTPRLVTTESPDEAAAAAEIAFIRRYAFSSSGRHLRDAVHAAERLANQPCTKGWLQPEHPFMCGHTYHEAPPNHTPQHSAHAQLTFRRTSLASWALLSTWQSSRGHGPHAPARHGASGQPAQKAATTAASLLHQPRSTPTAPLPPVPCAVRALGHCIPTAHEHLGRVHVSACKHGSTGHSKQLRPGLSLHLLPCRVQVRACVRRAAHRLVASRNGAEPAALLVKPEHSF
jgi:hypothetical protein